MAYIFKKVYPTEEINIGDLIMLDIATGLVTKTNVPSVDDYYINANNVIGVCSNSDNETALPGIIDCGNSNTQVTTLLNLGNSTTETEHIIICEDSVINPRELIEVESTGIVDLEIANIDNYCEPIRVGEKVIMGIKPNTVMKQEFDHREFVSVRTIGKIVEIIDNTHVKVLLDIE